MQTVHVSLADRPYPIHIGPSLIGNTEALAPFVKGTMVAIVTNVNRVGAVGEADVNGLHCSLKREFSASALY